MHVYERELWKVDIDTASHTDGEVEYCACDAADLWSIQSLGQILVQDLNTVRQAFHPVKMNEAQNGENHCCNKTPKFLSTIKTILPVSRSSVSKPLCLCVDLSLAGA